MLAPPPCCLCGESTRPLFSERVLSHHMVRYFSCPNCRLVRSESPFWLEEAYQSAIAGSDVSLVARNVCMSRITQLLLRVMYRGNESYLDYGGGYGMLTRLMRDAGFDFTHYDPLCPNIFARGFSTSGLGGKRFALATAFEVLEHLTAPLDHLDAILSVADSLLFTTELISDPPPRPNDWAYYCFHTGQHITFYSHTTLQKIADRCHKRLYSHGTIHLLTGKRLPSSLYRLVTSSRIARLAPLLPGRQAFTDRDRLQVMESGSSLPDFRPAEHPGCHASQP